ncbi:hypothetical protein CAEBREN_25356 [Caenorhabditis brenneri]|uniref:Uncharacterized protein n=1 Tax=Caenorhabditis brenneri TaxID=135651 RepID=G0NQ83_CAEBE|nr:hypothetical protein CAEBREN_25356 [Caenorhabditis brenneri]
MRCCSLVICIKAVSDIMAAAICGYLLQRQSK